MSFTQFRNATRKDLAIQCGFALFILIGIAAAFWGMAGTRGVSQTSSVQFHSLDRSGDTPSVDPTWYLSHSDEFKLHVDPSDRDGKGAAEYRMQRGEELLWSVRLPMTLAEAVVTDRGETIGYYYSTGFEGLDAGVSNGVFGVMILAADGTLRTNESTPRSSSRYLHEAPNPKCSGLIADEEHDRAIFRIVDPDVNRRQEAWWVYQISTGEKRKTLFPLEKMPASEHVRTLIAARPIKGTPLLALHWWRHEYLNPQVSTDSIAGAALTVVDDDANPLWQVAFPDDYEGKDGKDFSDVLRNRILQHGALLESNEPGGIEFFVASEMQAVRFQVRQEADAWDVTRLGSRDISMAEAFPPKRNGIQAMPLPVEIPEPLERLAPIDLELAGSAPVVRKVFDFTIDDQNRIAWIRASDREADEFVLINEQGDVLVEIPMPVGPDPVASDNGPERQFTWSACVWNRKNRFIVTRSEYGTETQSQAWWVDVDTRSVTPIDKLAAPYVEQIACFSDGGFVVLGTIHYQHTITDSIVGYDPQGSPTWQIVADRNRDKSDVFSPASIAVTPDDQIILLDNIRETLQWFDRRGQFIRSINLEEAWGRQPSYPTGVFAIADGNYFVHDFRGRPPYVFMGQSGKVIGEFSPKFDTGRAVNDNRVVVAPDQRVWMTDFAAIYRLGTTGIVDLVLGTDPRNDPMTEMSGSAVGHGGRIYLVDGRTASTHVFESSGRYVQTRSMPAEYYHGQIHFPSISIDGQGDSALLAQKDRNSSVLVRFNHEGQLIEPLRFPLEIEQFQYLPDTDHLVLALYNEVKIIDGTGRVVRTIRRRSDDRWLERIDDLAVATDGSFAVLVNGIVSIYDVNGDSLGVVPLPTTVDGYVNIALSPTHVAAIGNGKLVVLDRQFRTMRWGILEDEMQYGLIHFVAKDSELLLIPQFGRALTRYRITR